MGDLGQDYNDRRANKRVARSYRGKWRQRCEDLFKREEHFNYDDHFEADNRFDTDNRFDVDSSFDTDDSAHADGAFEADDFFNANGFYDTNDSDGKADHYSLKFPTVTALGFMDIPWPVQIPSCSKESVLANITEGDINPENVRSFLSALAGDEGVDELKVFNEALWYFCPERFDTQILPRIYDSHRCVVQDGVETVWRTLNDIFAHSDSSELILLEAELGEYSHWSTSLRDPNPPTKLPYL
ncbi:hypothetical protein CspeluHIS016_0307750 [Cutaneotrichosporon spelunceum]|uniref:Uncharacterized protein n=1 Tax=Cutaneotrichosporon spelunceum TaxID=1672016 RepID=A0AAD3TUY9_9TREE|nr:hypothetical protein CspeluHIS016_0307750 [Cutaneotrichosporon spelunceum]